MILYMHVRFDVLNIGFLFEKCNCTFKEMTRNIT